MAALTPISQDLLDVFRSGRHLVVSKVNHDGNTNTVDVPAGVLADNSQVVVLPLDKDDTVPTATVAQQAPAAEGDRQFGRVTLTGGDAGDFLVCTLHSGSAAAI